MGDWKQYLEEHKDQFQDDLLDFLRIPSVSSQSARACDVQKAAEWVADRLRRAGLEGVEILPTEGHPIVYGEWLHAPGKPTLLVYGHFDTQPADPVEAWTTPPFEPAVRDGRVYARGASDDKGNMLVPILAAEALLEGTGALPVNVKFFFEGQEEIGSPDLPTFLPENREKLACDLVVSADAGQWAEDQPAICIGYRGAFGLQIFVHGPRGDLHSGVYGGTIQNPIHALVEILGSLRDPHGRVLVAGFYDDVAPLSDDDRAQIAAVPFDHAQHAAQLGVTELFGEPGYTTLERAWARPTLEVCGIWGGGRKPVIPHEARAFVTCRLAPNQEPERVATLVREHVEKQAPPGVEVSVRPPRTYIQPYLMPADHPGNRVAAAVLRQIYGREPYVLRNGASLPICDLFLRHLDAYTVSFGFGLEDENHHAPDEFLRLASFERGQRAYCMLFERIAEEGL